MIRVIAFYTRTEGDDHIDIMPEATIAERLSVLDRLFDSLPVGPAKWVIWTNGDKIAATQLGEEISLASKETAKVDAKALISGKTLQGYVHKGTLRTPNGRSAKLVRIMEDYVTSPFRTWPMYNNVHYEFYDGGANELLLVLRNFNTGSLLLIDTIKY